MAVYVLLETVEKTERGIPSMRPDVEEVFICECHSEEHLFIVRGFDDSMDGIDDREIYLSVHLCQEHGFFRRIWTAIRYIFGYKSKYGDFGNCILKPDDVGRLRAGLDKIYPLSTSKKPIAPPSTCHCCDDPGCAVCDPTAGL